VLNWNLRDLDVAEVDALRLALYFGSEEIPMRAIWIAAVIAVVAAVGSSDVVYGQSGSEFGKYDYLRSCASCHGVTGRGNGPVAKGLTKSPADLTKLSEANKGVFLFARVYEVIDGRIEVMIHGPRDMPVWGEVFTSNLSSRQPRDFMPKDLSEAIVRVRILALIEYISTLQGK
jgi:mono/diheme cytochrome c family protein